MNILTTRRSIRTYDANYKISKEEMTEILNETLRAPSSLNMQPTRFFILESKEAKEKLRPILYGNHTQLDTSSAMVLLFTDLKKFDNAERIFDEAVKKGLMPKDVKERQLRSISNMVEDLDDAHIERTGVLDGGLSAMQFMLAAKSHGYDTCPIGGFRQDMLADVVGIDKKRYKPVLIISIGKAAENGYQSTRLTLDEVVTFK